MMVPDDPGVDFEGESKGEPWLVVWLALSLIAAMAIIVCLVLFYVYFLPVRFVTVVPKGSGLKQEIPLTCDFERPQCDSLLRGTRRLEI